jgi:hypothetical protein
MLSVLLLYLLCIPLLGNLIPTAEEPIFELEFRNGELIRLRGELDPLRKESLTEVARSKRVSGQIAALPHRKIIFSKGVDKDSMIEMEREFFCEAGE